MPRRAAQLYQFLSDVCLLVRNAHDRDYDKLVDAFDLTGSFHCIRRFLISGEPADLDEGLQRLEHVIGRQKSRVVEDARTSLIRVKELANAMSNAERHEALRFFEEGFSSPEWVSKHMLPEKIDLLVVAATFEPELRFFVDQLSQCREIVSSDTSEMQGLKYYEGYLRREEAIGTGPIRVVAAFQDQPGMVDCAILVTNCIRLFRPRMLALTGVCEGRANLGVKETDLVVPSAVVTYDAGKYTDKGLEQGPQWCEIDPKIIRKIRSQGPKILNALAERIRASVASHLRIPQLHTDVMACGREIDYKIRIVEEIVGANRKVVGMDMESYALIRAARITNPKIGALIVKGVADIAAGKGNETREHAAFWAAAFLKRFLIDEVETLFPYEGA